jgi:hypothetical protein
MTKIRGELIPRDASAVCAALPFERREYHEQNTRAYLRVIGHSPAAVTEALRPPTPTP